MIRTLPILLALLGTSLQLAGQTRSLASIERRHDVVALVADARTGRVVAGIRMAEARSERQYPASVFKLAIALASIDAGSAGGEHTCDGTDTLDGHAYRCWLDAGHGRVGFASAIGSSCNLYFRDRAHGLSRGAIEHAAAALGLLPESFTGEIDDEHLLGEAAPVTTGEMLDVALALASRGRLARAPMRLGAPRYEPLYRGLRECVRSGTGRAAWSRSAAIAGKTGTALRPGSRSKYIGWFIGFAPYRDPIYAVAVLHRNGMGSNAAAVAREILEALL